MTFDHDRDEEFGEEITFSFDGLVPQKIIVSPETYDWLIEQLEKEEQ